MNLLSAFLQPFGNEGSVANARTALDARQQEDRLIQALIRRLEATAEASSSTVPAAA